MKKSKKDFNFIGNYKDLFDPDDAHYPGSDEILAQGSPVGKKLGLKSMGIHIENLMPGRRTSWPHCESHEEEFAFVIKGTPEAWIDGEIVQLEEGDFVALPAGTGISHTFINNSENECLLLVGGNSKIEENKVFYPKHPKRNKDMLEKGVLWDEVKGKKLGPHDGLPDALRK